MIEDTYYDDNYDEDQDEYVYLEDEPQPKTFIGTLGQAVFGGLISYSISIMFTHVLFGRR